MNEHPELTQKHMPSEQSPFDIYRDALVEMLEKMGAKITVDGEDNEPKEFINQMPEIKFNELGLHMHPLEVEVEELIEKAQAGTSEIPPYDKSKHENPINYVKTFFGKYLNIFNGGQGDYLYLDQLGKIVPNNGFKSTFTKYVNRNSTYDTPIIPHRSDRLDKNAKAVSQAQIQQATKLTALHRRSS